MGRERGALSPRRRPEASRAACGALAGAPLSRPMGSDRPGMGPGRDMCAEGSKGNGTGTTSGNRDGRGRSGWAAPPTFSGAGVVMKRRASLQAAIEWIAENDEPTYMDVEDVARQVSTLLVADLFGKDAQHVARLIVRWRRGERPASAASPEDAHSVAYNAGYAYACGYQD